ncbi:MAG: CoA ester lyase [Usitatibacter sp.]
MSALPGVPIRAPAFRSLLYIPALASEFLAKAHTRSADVVIVDLEDSIPAARKSEARAALSGAVQLLTGNGVTVWVRVNSAPELLGADLLAAVLPGVDTILLPKVESGDQLRSAADAIGTADSINLSALVETPMGVLRLTEICGATPRLTSLAYGSEDLSLGLGVSPRYDALVVSAQMTLLAARAFGLDVYGVPGSVAEFRDLDAYRTLCEQAKVMGFDGVLCIHPSQVPEINRVFGLNELDRQHAERVVKAFDDAAKEGLGAVALEGKMIDLPVAERARRTLARR